ncbi:MAG: methionine--tRNA ligase [Flavobacteriales bacterium]|jgi:methionyl-tRNA synthetase|nr:methionine--tRNA ligase [Flavobacteriales bacterium]|tara:strand:+ start:34584 stop:36275 length:1692 start_codon:yes stop_codon:yes gene_type:complete
MTDSSRFTITAALPYANGPIHIGHLAGVYIPADIFARYNRIIGNDVLFVCGSDEHGVPITITAKKNNTTPKEIIDKYHKMIKNSFNDIGISFDIYDRTSSDIHHKTASSFFKKLYDDNLFEEKISEQYFDENENTFLADRYITGTCPICKHNEAYGDQCEKCGTSLDASELINPSSALSGSKLIKKKTKHWYLPLNKYQNWLEKWILNDKKKSWKTNVLGQCQSWIKSGLHPRAVTRDLEWGVKIPIQDEDGKVLYVWFDAPIGYISATKKWAQNNNTNWESYWCDDKTKLIHFIGKDNIVFHCIIFPSMLKAHGNYILPQNVPANEFLNLEGHKISTSRNWAVWLHEYLIEFPNQQDVLRYVLCVNAPETKDNDFTWKDFQARNNNELVAIFGNFINRVFVLCHKYWKGEVPLKHKLETIDLDMIELIKTTPSVVGSHIENYKFRFAIQAFIDLARQGNKYLAETEPWKLIKQDNLKLRTETILYISIQLAATLSMLCFPFMPFTAKKLQDMLGVTESQSWNNADNWEKIKSGHIIQKPSLLFSIIEDDAIEKQIQQLKDNK